MEEETKEVQQRIENTIEEEVVTDEEFFSVLKLVAPGSILRNALDGILHYGKGALIAVENDFLEPLIDGGFEVNSKFTPQKLIELSKMDGAMVISKDFKKILFANVLLTPNTKIKTNETGTRHKAAERTAKQISGLTVSISEKRKEITLFYKNRRHQLRDISEIVRKVNVYIQILERQRELFDMNLETLNRLELKNYINLNHAIKTIQRGKIIQKISKEAYIYLVELGEEGYILQTRLKEILLDVERETNLIIKDYTNTDYLSTIAILDEFSYEELLDKEMILKAMNHESLNKIVNVCGWRILSKTHLTESEIESLINEAKDFETIVSSSISTKFESLPEDKFSLLKVELEKLKLGL